MSLSKIELLRVIRDEFVSSIMPSSLRKAGLSYGYFNSGLRHDYIKKVKSGGQGFMLRIFDSIHLDPLTSQQFYDDVMQSDDPVQEYLIPLVGAISEQLFEPDSCDLNATIRADFKDYAAIKAQYANEIEFKNIIIKAIGAGCTAMLTEIHKKKMARYPVDSDEREFLANQLSAKITVPLDGYVMSLTANKLARDLSSQGSILRDIDQVEAPDRTFAWVFAIIQALLAFINRLRGNASDDFQDGLELASIQKDSPVETKVLSLIKILDASLDTLEPVTDPSDQIQQSLLDRVKEFRQNLVNVQDTISTSREMGLPFEDKAMSDFDAHCTKYYKILSGIESQAPATENDRLMLSTVIQELLDVARPPSPAIDQEIEPEHDPEHRQEDGSGYTM